MTISHEQGAPVMTFFVRDISRRKKAEEEQARYAAELERSNRELEQFAYVASHDLQEPLRKIRTFGDRLEMKCNDMLDEDGPGVRQPHAERRRADAGADRRPVVALPRHHAGPRVSCRSIWARSSREVVADLEVADRAGPGGRVEVGKLPTIQADPLQMRQLLQNLIANALKFHRVGRAAGGEDRGPLRHAREQRQARNRWPTRQCRIMVEDNGIGFEEQYAERIFGIFQRLHPRDVYEGTGIGLAICRRIVEHHGGRNYRPQHARQGIDLRGPAAGGPGKEETQRGRVMAKQHGPFTILMADDDADDCLLVQEALRESGQPHDLRIVRDGEQLLDYLRQQGEYRNGPPSPRPDLILSGPENAPQGRPRDPPRTEGRSRLRSIPIVVLTTSIARDDISFCYRMGVNSYVTKPATFRGLVDLLATVCKYWFEVVELPFVE